MAHCFLDMGDMAGDTSLPASDVYFAASGHKSMISAAYMQPTNQNPNPKTRPLNPTPKPLTANNRVRKFTDITSHNV